VTPVIVQPSQFTIHSQGGLLCPQTRASIFIWEAEIAQALGSVICLFVEHLLSFDLSSLSLPQSLGAGIGSGFPVVRTKGDRFDAAAHRTSLEAVQDSSLVGRNRGSNKGLDKYIVGEWLHQPLNLGFWRRRKPPPLHQSCLKMTESGSGEKPSTFPPLHAAVCSMQSGFRLGYLSN
jgi:hypothetical protein